jgi:hypothetical protein
MASATRAPRSAASTTEATSRSQSAFCGAACLPLRATRAGNRLHAAPGQGHRSGDRSLPGGLNRAAGSVPDDCETSARAAGAASSRRDEPYYSGFCAGTPSLWSLMAKGAAWQRRRRHGSRHARAAKPRESAPRGSPRRRAQARQPPADSRRDPRTARGQNRTSSSLLPTGNFWEKIAAWISWSGGRARPLLLRWPPRGDGCSGGLDEAG